MYYLVLSSVETWYIFGRGVLMEQARAGVPRLSSENTDLAQAVVDKCNTAGLTPYSTRGLRSGRSSDNHNWHPEQFIAYTLILF